MVLISVNQQSISPDLCMFYIMSSFQVLAIKTQTMSIQTYKQPTKQTNKQNNNNNNKNLKEGINNFFLMN